MHTPASLFEIIKAQKFKSLLFTLVFMILIYPYTAGSEFVSWFMAGFLLLTMIGIMFSVIDNPVMFKLACLQTLIISVCYALFLSTGNDKLYLTQLVLNIIFYGFAVYLLLSRVLVTKEICIETIFASVSVYILIAFTYGLIYALIAHLSPGAFQFNHANSAGLELTQYHLHYFSFTVLTTVGFGDIIPLNLHARSIVILEEITGVLYLAVFVSRLIGGLRES